MMRKLFGILVVIAAGLALGGNVILHPPNTPAIISAAISCGTSCDFSAPSLANTPVGTMSATLNRGSFAGIFTLSTSTANSGGCTSANSADNNSFNLSGTILQTNAGLTAGGGHGPNGFYLVCVAAAGSYRSSPFGIPISIEGCTGVGGALVASLDYYIPAITAPSGGAAPFTWGQVFRMGDVPAGNFVNVTDVNNNPLTFQIDQVATPYGDNSTRFAVLSALVPVVSGAATNQRVKMTLQAGTYVPGVTSRSIADVTAHRFQVHFQNVMTHPGNNDPFVAGHVYPWVNKGAVSSNYTFDVNAAIAAKQYRVTALGPVKISLHIYGYMTEDGGTADPHLWVDDYIDVYTNPSNPSGPPLYFEHMPEISQPFINSANSNVDFVIGQASYCDGVSTGAGCSGATTLRDYTDHTITMGPSDIVALCNPNCGGQTIFPFAGSSSVIMQDGMTWRVHLLPGGSTLPGGMTDGQPVWNNANSVANVPPSQIRAFELDPQVNNQYYGTATFPTSAGSQASCSSNCHASFQLIPYQHIAYYNGIFIVANDNGEPILSPGSWSSPIRFYPNLDATTGDTTVNSQKGYWIQSGNVPPWDLPFGNTILRPWALIAQGINGAGGPLQPYYEPGSNGIQRNGIDGGAGSWDTDGPWDEAAGVWFMTMGQAGWTQLDAEVPWARALASVHLPSVVWKRAPTGTGPTGDGNTGPNPGFIVPMDNGPGNSQTYPGTPWPLLGQGTTADFWYTTVVLDNAQTGWQIPAGVGSAPNWWNGTWGPIFSNYHWPPSSSVLEYLFYGKPYLLDVMAGNANRALLQQIFVNQNRTTPWQGTTYYGVFFDNSSWGEVISTPAAAGYFAPANDPIAPYFQNVIQQNAAYSTAHYNSISPGIQHSGMFSNTGCQGVPISQIGTYPQDGFNHAYGPLGYLYAASVARTTFPKIKLYLTQWTGMFDAPGNPATNSGPGTWGIANVGAVSIYDTLMGGWTCITNSFVPNPATAWWANDWTGQSLSVGSNGVINYNNGSAAFQVLTNGDQMWPVDFNASATGCIGPAEYCPTPLNAQNPTIFYICQLNTSATTFRLTPNPADDPTICPNAITSVATPGSYYWSLRPQSGTTGTNVWWGGGVDNMLRRAVLLQSSVDNIFPDTFWGVNFPQALAWFDARETLPSLFPTTGQRLYSRLFISRAITLSPALPPT